MTRAVVFLAAAMVAASLGVVAQDVSGGGTNSAPQNNTDNSAQHTVTVTGCLSSSESGVYTLAGDQGAMYTLAGNTDPLKGHAAQEIEVTGQQTFSSDTSSGTSGQTGSPTIQVTTAKLVSDRCKSSASPQSASPGPSASASAAAPTTQNSVGSSATGNRGPSAQNMAQDDATPATNNGQLPQTSTILPLLGLIGLGSLVAGFFARH
jgi:hypothetical protein